MKELKRNFMDAVKVTLEPKVLSVAVKLPTGAIEVITNTMNIQSKIDYYLIAYDSEFKLITNPEVRIVAFMLV